jgi:hypothetical protein
MRIIWTLELMNLRIYKLIEIELSNSVDEFVNPTLIRFVKSLLLNRPHLPLPIKAAMRANPMRGLRLVTLRTEICGGGAQRIVGTTLRSTRLRMSAFWIRHLFS